MTKDLGEVTVVATGGSLPTDPTRLDVTVTENDAETVQTYTLTAMATRVTEGGEVQWAVTTAPALEEETVASLTPSYSAESSMADVLMASASGTMLTLTPGQGPAGGMSTITVTALDSTGGSHASVMYMATVDALPAMITISTDPMDMVEEGGAITVTATLNQTAPHDKAIAVQVTGPATPKEAEISCSGCWTARARRCSGWFWRPRGLPVADAHPVAGPAAAARYACQKARRRMPSDTRPRNRSSRSAASSTGTPFEIRIDFPEPVVGMRADALIVTNGTVDRLTDRRSGRTEYSDHPRAKRDHHGQPASGGRRRRPWQPEPRRAPEFLGRGRWASGTRPTREC